MGLAGGALLAVLGRLLAAYGYWVVFIGLALESIVIVGMFTPGEITLLVAAAYSATGQLNPFVVWGLAGLGGVVGNVVSYLIGKHGGLPVVARWGHRVGLSEKRLAEARAYFHKHGAHTVFLGRWATGVKAWVPVMAGASRMRWAPFLAYSVAASFGWAAMMTGLGYFFGSEIGLLAKVVGRLGWVVLAVLVALVAFGWWRLRARTEAVLEEAVEEEDAADEGGAPNP